MAHRIVFANVTENQQKCKGWKDFFLYGNPNDAPSAAGSHNTATSIPFQRHTSLMLE